jgi:hypothetical protein
LAAGELGERGEGVDAVFPCGGNVGAQGYEVLGSGEGAHAAEFFCRILAMRIFRSVALLSAGTAGLVVKRR